MKGYSLYEDTTVAQESILGDLGAMLGIALFIFLGYFLIKLGIKEEEERQRVREHVIRMLRPYIPKFKKAYDNYDELVAEFNRRILPSLIMLQLFDGYRLDLYPQNLYDQDDFIEELVNELVYAITTNDNNVKHGEFPGYLEVDIPCAHINVDHREFQDENGRIDRVKMRLLEYSVDKIIRNISNKDSKLTVSEFSPFMQRLTIYVTIRVDITIQDVKDMRRMMDRGTIAGILKKAKAGKESVAFSIPEKYMNHARKLLEKHAKMQKGIG